MNGFNDESVAASNNKRGGFKGARNKVYADSDVRALDMVPA